MKFTCETSETCLESSELEGTDTAELELLELIYKHGVSGIERNCVERARHLTRYREDLMMDRVCKFGFWEKKNFRKAATTFGML